MSRGLHEEFHRFIYIFLYKKSPSSIKKFQDSIRENSSLFVAHKKKTKNEEKKDDWTDETDLK